MKMMFRIVIVPERKSGIMILYNIVPIAAGFWGFPNVLGTD